MICIFLNTIVLAFTWINEPIDVTYATELANNFFAGIFLLEAIMKLTAYSCRYFSDKWNTFDFVIVLGSLLGFGFKLAIPSLANFSPVTTAVRSFRIMRIFRLLKTNKSLKIIA